MINFSKMSGYHISQISHLQQSVWDLEKARANILFARGNSDVGRSYIETVDVLIEGIREDIDNIHAEYESSDIND